MILLGLDTATTTASIAVLRDDTVIATATRNTHRRTADVLVAVDEACRTAGITPAQLDAVGVGAGPGSFTGLRIGMATAKGIAFALGKPVWAVSSLAALALAAPGDGTVVAILDARKGEIFAGAFRKTGGAVEAIDVERVIAPSALVVPAGATTVGDVPALCAHAATPTGEHVARLALAGARVDVLVGGAPTYIRASEAEIRYPDGVPGALRKRDS
ncbi:MAG: tRNA (adenosine(37)-N6)-threonylcarbamoyltransferase complex dimerization subunit type 1 TsaB [Deltaproteobacteria bacterium]|nr:tRNA (adenosine(37)-N6)-threonylcarbamoyltransferase complex dimerization subunit type 1 TsaB [Deltaproteobacteria bacterium]